MNLPRTFVSFSSTDIGRYDMMCAWKAHDHIGFNFADFQLDGPIKSTNQHYIQSRCAAKIRRADTLVLLIGMDTATRTQFVRPEVEVAIEKQCRLIGVNLNDSRSIDVWCPEFFANRGAIFVPFSSRILARALKWEPRTTGNWRFMDGVYTELGYKLVGATAVLPPPPSAFQSSRPRWAT